MSPGFALPELVGLGFRFGSSCGGEYSPTSVTISPKH